MFSVLVLVKNSNICLPLKTTKEGDKVIAGDCCRAALSGFSMDAAVVAAYYLFKHYFTFDWLWQELVKQCGPIEAFSCC